MNAGFRKEYAGLANTLLLCLAGLCSLLIFAWPASQLHTPGFESELARHSLLLNKLQQQRMPLYSLWYLLQKLIVGNRLSETTLSASGLLLIGFFATLKGIILTGILRSFRFSPLLSLLGGVLLGTAIALPLPFVARYSPMIDLNTDYLGTIPANTFMSATQLVANVGALPAFYALQLWWLRPARKPFVIALLLCFLATLAKPGIGPALFVAISGCTAVQWFRLKQWHPAHVFQVLGAAALLLIPSAIVNHFYMSGTGWNSTKAVFAPFATWAAFSAQIGLDFLTSFAFPLIVVLMLAIQVVQTDRAAQTALRSLNSLLPALLATAAAVLIFICFAEKVDGRYFHSGNFIWAAISANAGLHLNCFLALKGLAPSRRLIPLLILLLEAAAGFAYIARYVGSGSYA